MENNIVNMPQAKRPEIIFDASIADFEQKVIMASMERPVIVDFWAPWCGPCKQLTPILEKAVTAAKGEVLLAKVNMDENQQLAAALQVQSIPAVFAFLGGRPVDAFQGAQPESAVKAFIDKLVKIYRQNQPDSVIIPEALQQAAQALAAKDLGKAQELYMQILSQDENNTPAYVGLIRLFLAAGQIEQARGWVENAPPEISKQVSFSEARTALELALAAPKYSLAELEAKLAKKPNDHQTRYDLALAQFTAGAREEAIESLIAIIEAKRGWNEDAARLQLLKFFEAMGHSDPVTIAGRKKLSRLLFS